MTKQRSFWVTLALSVALWGALAPHSALAQQSVSPCTRTTTGGCQAVSAAAPLPVTATVSVGGFAPSLAYATCTATGSACASTALPTNTGSVVLFNSGSTTVSCTLASGAATGTTSKLQIPASSGLALATVYGATTYDHFACIDQSGSASNVVIASGGSGLPTGWGGGGGGSGGAVTIADGADVALGTTSDAAWSSGSGTAIAILKNIAGGIASSIPAGSALIGKVGIDQTTPGTTNGVVNTPASPYPLGATPLTASATGTTGATTATLGGTSGKTTYICSYSVRANATAAANVQNTVTGIISGTRTDQMWVAPLASGLGVDEQLFTPCIPASGTNQAIAVVSGAPGTGGNVTVNAAGYQQ